MKKFLIMLAVLCAPISLMLAQSQKQITFSFEKGWQVSEFELATDYTVQLTDATTPNMMDQYKKIAKMESDLVHFTVDEKAQKVTMRLNLEKRPEWTSENWFAYLQRRTLLTK